MITAIALSAAEHELYNKALHGSPRGAGHGSCSTLLLLWQEQRQPPGARKLERQKESVTLFQSIACFRPRVVVHFRGGLDK